MSEYRRDPLTGAWVIIAPERGGRPRTAPRREGAARRPAYDPQCPFCPGNEHMLAGIIEEVPAAEPPGWHLRVVPNKYPALRPDARAPAARGFPWESLPGHGAHEVIVETPRHDASPGSLAPAGLAEVLRACRRRHAALIARPGIAAVVIFRNRGAQGGASLAHPHSQVIATALVPPRLAGARAWARRHFGRHGRCVTCEVMAREIEDGRRIVEATQRFVALVPFAAAGPFEQRILPRRHEAAFGATTDAELAELAELLQRTLARQRAALGHPSWNYVIESATAEDAGGPHAHWGLRLVPGTTRPGGFELGAGLPINPSLPESDAEALRSRTTGVPECGSGGR